MWPFFKSQSSCLQEKGPLQNFRGWPQKTVKETQVSLYTMISKKIYKGIQRGTMTNFAKWRCFALESLAVQGLWSWSVGEIVGLLLKQIKCRVCKQKFLLYKRFRKEMTYLAFANFLANRAFCPRPAAAPLVVIPGTMLADIKPSVSYTILSSRQPQDPPRPAHVQLNAVRKQSPIPRKQSTRTTLPSAPYSPSPLSHYTTFIESPTRHSIPSIRPFAPSTIRYPDTSRDPLYSRFDTPNGFTGMTLAWWLGSCSGVIVGEGVVVPLVGVEEVELDMIRFGIALVRCVVLLVGWYIGRNVNPERRIGERVDVFMLSDSRTVVGWLAPVF